MGVIRAGKDLFDRLRTSVELRRYTPNTIAEYLRKAGAQIGEGCYIVPTDFGTEPYLVKIGNHVAIAANVAFGTHDGATWVFRYEVPDLQVFGPIVIEDNCIIGQDAVLLPNIRIGPNSVVAAGSVVISDVPPNTMVMGVPARPFGSLEKYREKCLERWSQQRPPDVELEPGETWWNSRHYAANRERLKRHLLTLFADQLQ
jgi:acetyltransferase-like isoleucine patch superfamily enzyme